MVVLLDLDDGDACDPHPDPLRLNGYATPIKNKVNQPLVESNSEIVNDQRPNLNVGSFSAALGCYP